ncbi:MAG: glycosyltransferase [Spirochaetaceae bacterium]|nr:MAG: glycosyltransferase [Spirochaetaceae bacterium]
MTRAIQIVNSDFGLRNTPGARAHRIVQTAGETFCFDVFCRGVARDHGTSASVHRVGLGPALTKLLTAVNIYLSKNNRHKGVRRDVFGTAVSKRLGTLEFPGLRVVHTWESLPEVIELLRRRHPDVAVIRDISIEPRWAEHGQPVPPEELALFDCFIAPSQWIADRMMASGVPAEQVAVIPFGVDVTAFHPVDRAHAGRGPVKVAFTGQLTQRKGIPDLVEAWKRHAPANAELHLYGRVYPEVREVLRGAERHRIILHGFVDVTSILPHHDLYVLPTRREGSAKATYEALACGLPVITTPNCGSVVRDGVDGFLVEYGDVETLGARIAELCANTERRHEMGRRARERALEYTWERYGNEVVKLYQRLSGGE